MFRSHPVVAKALDGFADVPPGLVGVRGHLYKPADLIGHPGGDALVAMCTGTDATALFETHHLNIRAAERWLAALPTQGSYALPPASLPAHFERYARLRERVRAVLPGRVDRAASWSGRAALMVAVAAAAAAHVALLRCDRMDGALFAAVAVAALCNTVCGGFGHNALHRLEPASLLLDWNGLSSFEWLFEHLQSHHMHTNSRHDHDAISMRPFLDWLPPDEYGGDARVLPLLGWRGKHLIYAVGELAVAAQGYLGHRFRWVPLRDGRFPIHLRLAPLVFLARIASHIMVQGVLVGSVGLLGSMMLASYYFSALAHMSHVVLRDGAPCGDFLDRQVRNTTDLLVPPGMQHLSLYLDRQVAHHLFPSVDHSRLPALGWLIQEAVGGELPNGSPAELNRRVNTLLCGTNT